MNAATSSWKTSLAGAIAGLGVALTQIPGAPSWLLTLGGAMATVGTVAMGLFAKDHGTAEVKP